MDPFVTSKVINFIHSKFRLDNVADPSKSYDRELRKLFEKGENHVNSDHIRKFSREQHNQISGLVDPSYGGVKIKQGSNTKSYSVWVNFTEKDGPTESYCTCPVGNFICSHVLALILFGQKMLSRTDFQSVWSRTANNGPLTNDLIKEIWTKGSEQSLLSPVKQQDLEKMKSLIDKNKQFGLSWLLSDDNPTEGEDFKDTVEKWVSQSQFHSRSNLKMWLLEKFKVNSNEITQIAEKTKGQRDNVLWLKLRKFRITASTFGLVLAHMIKAHYSENFMFPDSFFKTLLGEYKLDKVKAISYGLDHERDAIGWYETTTGLQVSSTGLHLFQCGYLGASPDGLIDKDGIIEVKCPYSARNKTLDEFLDTKNSYLVRTATLGIRLKEDHHYFHQIQGTMYATGRFYCDFVCWSPNWSIVTRINKLSDWKLELNLIEIFYEDIFMDFYLNKLQNKISE